MSLPGRLVSVDGVRVFVHRTGGARRPPVLLLHGYLISHWEWRHVIPELAAAGHDVIAIDLPGFGESDRPAPAAYRYEPDAYLRTITGVLDALGVEQASVVGHSMGGGLALLMAAERPERVARVVVIDPLVYGLPLPLEARAVLTPVVGPWLFRAFYTRGVFRRVMQRDIYRDPAMASDEWIDYLWERVNRPGGLEAAHTVLSSLSSTTAFARAVRGVRAPALIVWGEDDRLFPSSLARRLSDDLAGAAVRIIPVCGHSPPEERPKELLRALVPFLAARDELRASA